MPTFQYRGWLAIEGEEVLLNVKAMEAKAEKGLKRAKVVKLNYPLRTHPHANPPAQVEYI